MILKPSENTYIHHSLASIYEVATNLDLTINKIKHFLRDGRIEVVEKDNQFLSCKTCGKPIHSGWYCEDCLKQSKSDSNNRTSMLPQEISAQTAECQSNSPKLKEN